MTPITSAEILKHDFSRISEWAYRFNSDPLKQAEEVLNATKANYPSTTFDGNTVQKSADLLITKLLTFNDHITFKLATVNKLSSTLRKLLL